MEISTLLAYEGYLNFLKIVGIFPYKFHWEINSEQQVIPSFIENEETRRKDFSSSTTTASKKLSAIGFHTRGFFNLTHGLTFLFFYSYGAFELGQFIYRAWSGAGAIELFGLSCWLWKPIFVAVFIIHFRWRRKSVEDFHTNWHRIESSIYKGWTYSLPEKLSEIRKEIRQQKIHAMIYIPIWTIGIISLIVLNHIQSPEFTAYMSSYLNNPLDPVKYSWLLYVSIIIQMYAFVPILLTFDHFHFLCLTFSTSVSRVLKLITNPFQETELNSSMRNDLSLIHQMGLFDKKIFVNSNTSSKLVDKMKRAMQHFRMLEELTAEFNRVYRWMFFLYKGIILVNFVILIFVPLRFSRIFPWTSLMVFFISAAFFSFNLLTVLPAMGAVWADSSEFQSVWLKRLPELSDKEWIGDVGEYLKVKGELDGCLPFGFMSGSFYTVMPGSMLSFFSIATSYLIVLLQLDISY